MRLPLVLLASLAGGCVTARGLADDGHLKEACWAVERNPSPFFDDDGPALASRVRQKIPGQVTTRMLDAHALTSTPSLLLSSPALLEVVVEAAAFSSLGPLTLVDAVGTRVSAKALDAVTVLAMFGAPAPPSPIVTTSTHTPGPIESLVKTLGALTIGLPISIATLGLVGPELNGLFSTGPSTTTSSHDSPELAAWRALPEVVAAVELGTALGVAQPSCFGGRCRIVVGVWNVTAFTSLSMPATLELEGCQLHDVLDVPLSSKPLSTPLALVPADRGQWRRFQATNYGITPLFEDLFDAADDCCRAPFDLIDDCLGC